MDPEACALSLGVGFSSGVVVYSAVLAAVAVFKLLKRA